MGTITKSVFYFNYTFAQLMSLNFLANLVGFKLLSLCQWSTILAASPVVIVLM